MTGNHQRRKVLHLRHYRPTLLLKALLLSSGVLVINTLIWALSGGILKKNVLGLALIAWTTGLRHGLDADHITTIDNVVRRIMNSHNEGRSPKTPITTGTFFSLGHSTIVLSVIIAIAMSVSIASKLDAVGSVGGVIGTAVSGSMLMLLAIINACILFGTVRKLRRVRRGADADAEWAPRGCFARMAKPLLLATDHPWKMYPIGVLYGIGFDTASSIALLSVSAIASTRSDAHRNGSVVLLALLFASGMCLVDSLDSIMMVYVYSPSAMREGWKLLRPPRDGAETETEAGTQPDLQTAEQTMASNPAEGNQDASPQENSKIASNATVAKQTPQFPFESQPVNLEAGHLGSSPRVNVLTPAVKLSLVMTTASILMAFTISLIQILSLIADQCGPCAAAAEKQQETGDGGLAGRWWLGWQDAADKSTYIGIGIVGAFALALGFFMLEQSATKWIRKRRKTRIVAQQS
ncbi:NicO-domain-containing protein [Tilletiaria anomala UBC 951]|uniref:Nickel/cobalt efflux system n=1 Tax=Tilletiaria anomala (strain ATCC 24038 / CBS 436.72 / UBC 951) TaxID=1037660 RepID=A0A066WRV4_TILAU|nr:NicO-domain-containing protein [Tilletiaria anomala UBC 951]KDN53375.1 NicO-domain-containing protein [Tilletiaria anomala UBC 951]